jgi:hypothetical protein
MVVTALGLSAGKAWVSWPETGEGKQEMQKRVHEDVEELVLERSPCRRELMGRRKVAIK